MEKRHESAVAVVGIVDDDPAVRNSLKFSLEIDGFVVRTYGNAEALLNEADFRNSVVLLSIRTCLERADSISWQNLDIVGFWCR